MMRCSLPRDRQILMFITSWYAVTSLLRTSTIAWNDTRAFCSDTITSVRSTELSPFSKDSAMAPAEFCVSLTCSTADFSSAEKSAPPAAGALWAVTPWAAVAMVRSCVKTWLMSISLMSSFPSCHPDQSRISRVEAFGEIDALFAHARELVTQRAFADTQFFRGIFSTAFARAQRFDDHAMLAALELVAEVAAVRSACRIFRRAERSGRLRLRRRVFEVEVVRADYIALTENESALHHVVELAHVARPAMRQQPLLRFEAQHRHLHLAVAL